LTCTRTSARSGAGGVADRGQAGPLDGSPRHREGGRPLGREPRGTALLRADALRAQVVPPLPQPPHPLLQCGPPRRELQSEDGLPLADSRTTWIRALGVSANRSRPAGERPAPHRHLHRLRPPGLAVTLHIDDLRGTDAPGLPGLRRMLATCPDTVFFAHARTGGPRSAPTCARRTAAATPNAPSCRAAPSSRSSRRSQHLRRPLGLLGLQRPHPRPRVRPWLSRTLEPSPLLRHRLPAPRQDCPIIEFIRTVDISRAARRGSSAERPPHPQLRG